MIVGTRSEILDETDAEGAVALLDGIHEHIRRRWRGLLLQRAEGISQFTGEATVDWLIAEAG